MCFGRPPKLNAEQEQLARGLIGEGRLVREIARIFNIHMGTIYRLSGSANRACRAVRCTRISDPFRPALSQSADYFRKPAAMGPLSGLNEPESAVGR